MGYEIQRIYNNNVVLAMHGDESVILVSKGIGFGKKIGQIIENNQSIEKVFYELNPNEKEFNIKKEGYKVGEAIAQLVQLAELEIGSIHKNIEKVLNEHIQFALERIEMGIVIENPFLEEIISLYPKEFELAGVAAKLIEECTGVTISEEERGFIALHLRSARDNQPIGETLKITRMYKQCMKLVEKYLEKKMDLRAKKSKMFLSNLAFLVECATRKNNMSMPIKSTIKRKLSTSYKIAYAINELISKEKEIYLTEDLIAYLAIEIEKLNC